MNYKQINWLGNWLFAGGCVISVFPAFLNIPFPLNVVLIAVSVLSIAAAFFVKLKLYKCPHCKASLLEMPKGGHVCPKCGVDLDK